MAEKVIFLANDISLKGGTNRVMADIVRALSAQYNISVISLEGEESAYPYPDCVGKVFFEDGTRSRGRILNTLRTFRKLPALVRLIRREEPGAVVSFLPRANLGNVISKKLSGLNYRCIVSERNFTTILYEETLPGKLMKLLLKVFYKHSDTVVATAEELGEEVARIYGVPRRKIRVIYNPYDLTKIEALSREDVEIAWFNEDIPLILTAGRLIKQKNHAMLLRAMKRVSEKFQVRLVIFGEGPLKEGLIRTAANLGVDKEVLLPGWRDNLFKYMSRAKVFALSSDYEGLPNVLIEALACGVPVISTDCPSGPKEILCGGKYGIVVPVGDEEAMAEGIIRLLEDGTLRKELAMRGKERVRDFEITRIVKEYRELFT